MASPGVSHILFLKPLSMTVSIAVPTLAYISCSDIETLGQDGCHRMARPLSDGTAHESACGSRARSFAVKSSPPCRPPPRGALQVAVGTRLSRVALSPGRCLRRIVLRCGAACCWRCGVGMFGMGRRGAWRGVALCGLHRCTRLLCCANSARTTSVCGCSADRWEHSRA